MPRTNVPLVSFNRGLIDQISLGRVDLDRALLSAEKMTNWVPKTQGAMRIRPGMKYLGSTLNDSGAFFIEFVESTDDKALLELTKNKMRIWDSGEALIQADTGTRTSDTGSFTSLSITDTGWKADNVGGGTRGSSVSDIIPQMTSATTGGVTIDASDEDSTSLSWKVGDNDAGTRWEADSAPPEWLRIDFGTTVNIKSITLRAPDRASQAGDTPQRFWFGGSNSAVDPTGDDTGGGGADYERHIDTGYVWSETAAAAAARTPPSVNNDELPWAVGEKRTYTDTGFADQTAHRYWTLHCTKTDDGGKVAIAELECFPSLAAQGDTGQVSIAGGTLVLNAGSIGGLARTRKRVGVEGENPDSADAGDALPYTDTGQAKEHYIHAHVDRGPVTLRIGSTSGDDDYVSETNLEVGHHRLAFTPTTHFHITLQTSSNTDKEISLFEIADTGTIEVSTPWDADDLDNIRFDQSADIVFVDCEGVAPHRIERRGTGRSWSVVENRSTTGPFRATTSSAKMAVTNFYGAATLLSDTPFFDPKHKGALFRLTHEGQSGKWLLGGKDAVTDAIEVTGVNDTGSDTNNERRLVFDVSGAYQGQVTIERSFDSPSYGFQPAITNFETTGPGSASADTGTFNRAYEDEDDNLTVWYRARLTDHTDTGPELRFGTAVVTATYPGGFKSGICRVTDYVTNKQVKVEVLTQFSQADTGVDVDTGTLKNPTAAWEEGSWSAFRGYPTVPALHEGRLFHAGKSNVWASVTDDYTNFSDDITDATAPISKTLGSGPINNIYWLLSLQTLVAGSSGSEISIRSSALDEPLTRTNAAARQFSTLGSANIRALKHDTEAFLVNRSKQRVYRIAIGFETVDYEPVEMSVLVPSLMEEGIVSCAIQRQPDSRFYFVLADGKCAVMTYEAEEDVLAWCLYETDGTIERVMTLPGIKEDRVFFLVKRTINSVEKRFLEKVMLETESVGDTGLSWLADSAVSFTTDTGRSNVITGLTHLEGESVIVWGSGDDLDQGQSGNDNVIIDTGNPSHGKDKAYDTGSPRVQKTYTVSSGQITLDTGVGGVHHAVVGLAYDADFKSAKLAYGAEAGTALSQMKRVDKIALVLHKTHNNAVFFGRDTGDLDPMPRVIEGARVNKNQIFAHFDQMSMVYPGEWNADSRIYIRAKAPRPATVIGLVPTIGTSEKV